MTKTPMIAAMQRQRVRDERRQPLRQDIRERRNIHATNAPKTLQESFPLVVRSFLQNVQQGAKRRRFRFWRINRQIHKTTGKEFTRSALRGEFLTPNST